MQVDPDLTRCLTCRSGSSGSRSSTGSDHPGSKSDLHDFVLDPGQMFAILRISVNPMLPYWVSFKYAKFHLNRLSKRYSINVTVYPHSVPLYGTNLSKLSL